MHRGFLNGLEVGHFVQADGHTYGDLLDSWIEGGFVETIDLDEVEDNTLDEVAGTADVIYELSGFHADELGGAFRQEGLGGFDLRFEHFRQRDHGIHV